MLKNTPLQTEKGERGWKKLNLNSTTIIIHPRSIVPVQFSRQLFFLIMKLYYLPISKKSRKFTLKQQTNQQGALYVTWLFLEEPPSPPSPTSTVVFSFNHKGYKNFLTHFLYKFPDQCGKIVIAFRLTLYTSESENVCAYYIVVFSPTLIILVSRKIYMTKHS